MFCRLLMPGLPESGRDGIGRMVGARGGNTWYADGGPPPPASLCGDACDASPKPLGPVCLQEGYRVWCAKQPSPPGQPGVQDTPQMGSYKWSGEGSRTSVVDNVMHNAYLMMMMIHPV